MPRPGKSGRLKLVTIERIDGALDILALAMDKMGTEGDFLLVTYNRLLREREALVRLQDDVAARIRRLKAKTAERS